MIQETEEQSEGAARKVQTMGKSIRQGAGLLPSSQEFFFFFFFFFLAVRRRSKSIEL
jgi:hypothetical protein